MLLQEGLTKRIITALGLDSKYSTPVDTPAETAALGRDVNGEEASGTYTVGSFRKNWLSSIVSDIEHCQQLQAG